MNDGADTVGGAAASVDVGAGADSLPGAAADTVAGAADGAAAGSQGGSVDQLLADAAAGKPPAETTAQAVVEEKPAPVVIDPEDLIERAVLALQPVIDALAAEVAGLRDLVLAPADPVEAPPVALPKSRTRAQFRLEVEVDTIYLEHFVMLLNQVVADHIEGRVGTAMILSREWQSREIA